MPRTRTALVQRYDNEPDILAIEERGYSDTYTRAATDEFDLVVVIPTGEAKSSIAMVADAVSGQYSPTGGKPWPGRPDRYPWRVDVSNIRYIDFQTVRRLLMAANAWKGQWTVRIAALDEDHLTDSTFRFAKPVPVQTVDHVIRNLNRFNAEAPTADRDVVDGILRRTDYWVMDSASGLFAPSKFAGIRDMSLDRYAELQKQARDEDRVAGFDGNISWNSIERAVGGKFVTSPDRVADLDSWAKNLLGHSPLGRIDSTAWKFIDLSERKVSAQDALSVETEDVKSQTSPHSRAARGQGFFNDTQAKIAVELHAVRRAIEHYTSLGYTVADISSTDSCDLRCEKGDEQLLVEVKGTTTLGQTICVTKNEVTLMQSNYPSTALFIVHTIDLSGDRGKRVATGGQVREVRPWQIADDDLKPLSFSYTVRS